MANALYCSDALDRLTWRIPAPLESAISVSANPRPPRGPSVPYFGRTLSGGSWHDVSEEPVSSTRQSSIAVTVSALDSWAAQWEEYHEDADPDDDDDCEFAPDDDDGPGELLRYHGEKRPQAPPPLVITATTKEYVTVHDYVSALHPWLMEHFDAISSAVNVWNGGQAPPGQRLFVAAGNLRDVEIYDEERWQRSINFQPSQPTVPPSGAAAMNPPFRIMARQLSLESIRRLNASLRERGLDEFYPEI
ncbi:hypothetical protein NLG97_g2759 [Lecanicillium saksenae]|uniref:Uncharacterized protein n=1 Tax=Lecanicillium saksenae TaxID=468837 RepID=A0ACC1R3D7_9HYPO|nr:hypothetical protein NLG97_g2759 [Lecanicillium saksenae]